MPRLSARELDRLTKVDYLDHLSLVAMLGGEIIGMAGYDRWTGSDEAEVAFITDDAHHGRGLATVLLEWLVVAAREVGFAALTAQVLPTNRSMLAVFHQVGLRGHELVRRRRDRGAARPRADRARPRWNRGRERRAEARSVERLISPTSVAVIGAGRERGGLGHEVFRNLLAHDFWGPCTRSTRRPLVAGVPSYSTVLDIPHEVDLAVIAVPARGAVGRRPVRPQAGPGAGRDERGARRPLGDGRPTNERSCIGRSGACASSGPSRSASSAPRRSVRSSPPLPTSRCCPAGSASSPSRARSASPRSSTPAGSASASRRSSTSAAARRQRQRRAAVLGGRPAHGVVLLYLESFGNPRKFTRIARELARTSRSSR